MAHRTTDPVQRVDMLLAQAEQFLELQGAEEAIARAKQVMAYAELEMDRTADPILSEQLAQRLLLAEQLIVRLGNSVRDRRGRLSVHAEDAMVAESWD